MTIDRTELQMEVYTCGEKTHIRIVHPKTGKVVLGKTSGSRWVLRERLLKELEEMIDGNEDELADGQNSNGG